MTNIRSRAGPRARALVNNVPLGLSIYAPQDYSRTKHVMHDHGR